MEMLTQWFKALSKTDKTAALLLVLMMGISAVSSCTVFLYKRSEEKDAVNYVRTETARAAVDSLHRYYIGLLHQCDVDKMKYRDEFMEDLKAQRDRTAELDRRMAAEVKAIKIKAIRNSQKLDNLKHEVQ